MRRAITLARKHGENSFSVLIGPEVHLNAHSTAFKASIDNPSHDFAEIEVWTSSSGVTKRKKFHPHGETAPLAPGASEQLVLDKQTLETASLTELRKIASDLSILDSAYEMDRERLIAEILTEVALRDEIAEEERAKAKDPGTF